jgi:hypothetical protein
MMGEGIFAQGPVLGVRVEESHFALGLGLQGRLPVQVGNDDLNLRLGAAGGRISFAGWLSASPTLRFVLAAGVGADLVHAEPRRSDAAGVRPGPSFWSTDAVVALNVAVDYRMRGVSLALLSGFELGLTEVRYVLDNASDAAPIFVPWRLRPLVGVEIGVPLSF